MNQPKTQLKLISNNEQVILNIQLNQPRTKLKLISNNEQVISNIKLNPEPN